MRNHKRRLYLPNYLAKRKFTHELVRSSSIGKSDLVIEIGPGKGRITRELLDKAGKVIAIEIDAKLYQLLAERFKSAGNLELVHADFLQFSLPRKNYKVFANIPFAITSDIVRKLTRDEYFDEAYLVVQKEAAKRFIGMPFAKTNSMMAAHLKPWFEIDVVWKFKSYDFEPMPKVETVLIRIKRREVTLVPIYLKSRYEKFVRYYYNRNKTSKMKFSELLAKFLLK